MNASASTSQQPAVLVEIDSQEEARLIQEHRVDAGDEWLTGIIAADRCHRMTSSVTGRNQRFGHSALDARLFADACIHSLAQAGV
jgi:hypothetical protein